MSEATQTYHPRLLQERRATQSKQIFRRRLGALAVMAGIVVPVSAAGGVRPAAHDALNFAKDRAEMISDALSTGGANSQVNPEQARIQQQINQTVEHNKAVEASQNQ